MIEWTEEEIMLVKKYYEQDEPLPLIGARLNYTHSVDAIHMLARSRHFLRNRKKDIKHCKFCYSEFTEDDMQQVTHTYYNKHYCKKCNIAIESLQTESIMHTIIANNEKQIKSKQEVNDGFPTKVCCFCKKPMPVDFFNWQERGVRLQSRCKFCRNKKIIDLRKEST